MHLLRTLAIVSPLLLSAVASAEAWTVAGKATVQWISGDGLDSSVSVGSQIDFWFDYDTASTFGGYWPDSNGNAYYFLPGNSRYGVQVGHYGFDLLTPGSSSQVIYIQPGGFSMNFDAGLQSIVDPRYTNAHFSVLAMGGNSWAPNRDLPLTPPRSEYFNPSVDGIQMVLAGGDGANYRRTTLGYKIDSFAPVPEPGTVVACTIGLAAFLRRRTRS